MHVNYVITNFQVSVYTKIRLLLDCGAEWRVASLVMLVWRCFFDLAIQNLIEPIDGATKMRNRN